MNRIVQFGVSAVAAAAIGIGAGSGIAAAIIYGVRTNGANTAGTFSEGPAKTAIQGYLN
ncbi:hypothetical protein GR255_17740, partial [Mycobacterium tuberculosis]|nr:hypothetical protein [Mycobacterium tuberculosis]